MSILSKKLDLSDLVEGKDYTTAQVIVKFKPGIQQTAINEINAFKQSLGASVQSTTKTLGIECWTITGCSVADAIATCSKNPLIEYAEPNYLLSINTTIPNDPNFNQLWGLNNTGQTGGTLDADIDAPEAWDISTGNKVVVGVIDTGVDYTHADLKDNMWTNPGETPGNGIDDDGNGYIDDYYGYDFINNDGDPLDDHSHGTHVAGTIAAKGNNGIGVIGVAPQAKIMALKIFNANGNTDSFSAIKAIEYSTTMGVKLTNNSWGGGGYSQTLYDAIAAAGKAGQLFIASAGNSGSNNDTNPSYPASYNLDNIIAVANTNQNDQLSGTSNYGSTSVDLGAPGSSIYSTIPGGGYSFKSGTSMAAPHVSGVAALLFSQNPGLSYLDVKNKILNSVDPIPALQGKTVSGGRLNAYKALTGGTTPPLKFTGDDFDPNIDNTQWSSISGAIANSKFAGKGNSLFFSNNASRNANSIGADVSKGSSLSFDLIFGNGSNGGEDADAGEDVVLEYSLDGGSKWTLLKTYDTEAYTKWTTISEAIPQVAQTSNTSFRWRQLTNSGVGFDEWGLDNIKISQTPSVPSPIFGTPADDELNIFKASALVFAGSGNDRVDASAGKGNNRLYGGDGDDTLFASVNDRLFGEDGDDILFAGDGNSLLNGGDGADQFWIATADLPSAANKITDFEAGIDVIGLGGLGVTFADLSITQVGNDALIRTLNTDLAMITGIQASTLTSNSFVFV